MQTVYTQIKVDEVRGYHQDQDLVFKPVTKGFQVQYKYLNGCLYQGNSFDWLESLDDASVDLVFADPPYNIKKADWDNFDSQEKYIERSIKWIKQASRVLKPTGSLYALSRSHAPRGNAV